MGGSGCGKLSLVGCQCGLQNGSILPFTLPLRDQGLDFGNLIVGLPQVGGLGGQPGLLILVAFLQVLAKFFAFVGCFPGLDSCLEILGGLFECIAGGFQRLVGILDRLGSRNLVGDITAAIKASMRREQIGSRGIGSLGGRKLGLEGCKG